MVGQGGRAVIGITLLFVCVALFSVLQSLPVDIVPPPRVFSHQEILEKEGQSASLNETTLMKRNPKYFREPKGHPHADARYFKNITMHASELHARLYAIMRGWARWAPRPWWMTYGTLLGAWRDGAIIAWDNDLDVAMLRADLLALPPRVLLEDEFVFERNKYATDESAEDRSNTIDARVIDMNSGLFLDIIAYHHVRGAPTLLANKAADKNLTITDIFPLSRLPLGPATYPAPCHPEPVLHAWYGSSLAAPSQDDAVDAPEDPDLNTLIT